MNLLRFLVPVCLLAVLAALSQTHVGHYLTLGHLQQSEQSLRAIYLQDKALVRVLYFLFYVVASALSLPGAILLNLASGAIFGLGWGLLLSSFGASVGATLAFLAARFLFRASVQRRFGARLQAINQGLQHEGIWYLFSLRLIPLIPYFVINLAMGVTNLRIRTFYWVTQLGMLLPTTVYVNAGQQLSELHSLRDVFQPTLLVSFTLLALLPVAALRLRKKLRKPPTNTVCT